MANLEETVNELCKKYSLPKRALKKFDSLKIYGDLSINEFIVIIKNLDGLDKWKIVSTPGLPQEAYRLFLNEKPYNISFMALMSVNMQPVEWSHLFQQIKSCHEKKKRDFSSWVDGKKFTLFAKSSACPLNILKKYEKLLENVKEIEDPSDFKYYYSKIVKSRENLESNIIQRNAVSGTRDMKRLIADLISQHVIYNERLVAKENNIQDELKSFSELKESKFDDPEDYFRKEVGLRIQSLYLKDEQKIWTNAAWGKYIGLPQLSIMPVKARLEIAYPHSHSHYELAALLAMKSDLSKDQLSALAMLQDFDRDHDDIVRSNIFERLTANPSTPIESLIANIDNFLLVLDPAYKPVKSSLKDKLDFFSISQSQVHHEPGFFIISIRHSSIA